MARPISLPFDLSIASGNTPVTEISSDFAAVVAGINDSSNGASNFASDTGAVNSYVVTLPSTPSAYVSGMLVSFVAANTNTGASVINVNALGSKSILNVAGSALQAGDIPGGSVVTLLYTGTSFQLIGIAGSGLPVLASEFAVVPGTGNQAFVSIPGITYQSGTSGGSIHLNPSSSSLLVNLTPPGANKYYATLCFSNSVVPIIDVFYGAVSASPTLASIVWPVNPNDIPIAVVLLTAGQSQVHQADITDIRQLLLQRTPVTPNTAAIAGSPYIIDCFGAPSVTMSLTTSLAALTIQLINLSQGVPVNIYMGNTGGGTCVLKFTATDPNGSAFSSVLGTHTEALHTVSNMVSTGYGITTGAVMLFQGNTMPAALSPLNSQLLGMIIS